VIVAVGAADGIIVNGGSKGQSGAGFVSLN
jgi:hypothetical protein